MAAKMVALSTVGGSGLMAGMFGYFQLALSVTERAGSGNRNKAPLEGSIK